MYIYTCVIVAYVSSFPSSAAAPERAVSPRGRPATRPFRMYVRVCMYV